MPKKPKTPVKPASLRTKLFVRLQAIPNGVYLWLGVSILLLSTAVWSYWGATIQLGNSDQLINAYLFDSPSTLQGALLPAQHTFLMKAPLIWLVHVFGDNNAAFITVTTGMTLLTVGGLVFILYKIVQKPKIFGLLCLAVASMLLVIPAQPHPGALLPINMAMLTTRNIEYIVFLCSIILVAKMGVFTVRSWRLWLAVACTALLVASDQLFLPLYVGGSLLMLATYAVLRVRQLAMFAVTWLGVAIGGSAIAFGIIQIVGRFVHIIGGGAPYAFTSSLRPLATAVMYAILGFLTNVGANPAASAGGLKDVPQQISAYIVSLGGLAFIINVIVVGAALLFIAKFVWASRIPQKKKLAWPGLLLLALLSSTVVAVAAFVATNHYYPVDARYLTISFFAVTVGLAVAAKKQQIPKRWSPIVLGVFVVATASGFAAGFQAYQADTTAMTTLNTRNTRIAAVLKQHPVNTLVGDYWRVVPTRQQAANKAFTALPFDDCSHPRGVLSSTQWQSFEHLSFAYVLSFDDTSPDFPKCSLDQVVTAYGKPNKSIVIDGTRDAPQEVLLFYDQGVRPLPHDTSKAPATVVPIALSQLPTSSCPGDKTILTTVAHQDDDLLFMNPDRLRTIQAGDCIRTIYLTAGDAGSDQFCWIGREKGSETAYDAMMGTPGQLWIDRIVKLPTGQFIVMANPANNPRISLIFMRLPDGNVNGSGFKATHAQSLARLEAGKISSIQTINQQSSYTSDQLTGALSALMNFYNPDEVDTQAPLNLSRQYPDHSDHITTGLYTEHAYDKFHAHADQSVIKYYIGYPIHGSPANVTGKDYQEKSSIFFAYSQHDVNACSTFNACNKRSVYGEYLQRQYQYTK